ncbi:MCE family protein [Flavobacterium alvei]|uniref:MCE family protein n=1 Tax=Flavobacterium alvei TaxID=2080416 RepID=A0A2S5AF61_9FLAO|nr:MlaD family protein [Flavobacterium alvei]POY40939.1 MCE family protein [Flavobacterium alvei]HQE33743.1 MlaD family protein [Flavobacterium alvei]HQF47237.1 MlaD family protein [Flavobacterium alvei]HQK39262.1 MlaD family protein [Flavobacterium alvei]
MEKSASQKIYLGLFVIFGLLILILAVYFIGDKQKMFGKTNHLEAVFNNVNGLQLGNNVRYSGISVGTVRGIEMINDTTVRVDMIIDKAIFPYIKKDAIATISSDGLVGNMIINIIPGKENQPSIEPGETIKTFNRIRTEDLLNTLSITNKNAATLTANLLKITDKIIEGKGTIGSLLNDTLISRDLGETMRYLKLTTKSASETVSKIDKIVTSLDNKDNVLGVIKDTAVAHNLKITMANLAQSTSEINKVVTNLNATILNIKDGKGSINYLSNNPDLVRKIDSTMTNLNAASIKLNEDLEAMKHNFLLRGYFKKQEKENKK